MAVQLDFNKDVAALARKHGFSCEIDPVNGSINMSKRNSAGDDEPHPAVIKAGTNLVTEIAEAYPVIKTTGAISMEIVDEWVELSIYTKRINHLQPGSITQ